MGGNELICTEDHKPQREDEVKRIQAAGGSVIHGPLGSGPMRVDGMLAVSRALGDFHFKPPGMNPGLCKVTAMPEVQTVAHCKPGDWLFLACDGVFDVMDNEEVKEFVSVRLRNAAPELANGGTILVELLKHCINKGSKDNCTACLVQLHEGGTPIPPSRQLFQGPWVKATPNVQAKYAQFFIAHGFEEEAKALQATAAAEPSSTKDEALTCQISQATSPPISAANVVPYHGSAERAAQVLQQPTLMQAHRVPITFPAANDRAWTANVANYSSVQVAHAFVAAPGFVSSSPMTLTNSMPPASRIGQVYVQT